MKKQPIVFFALALAVIGVAGFFVRNDVPAAANQSKNAVRQYHCPMHPNIVSDKPGDCPICNMRLVPNQDEAVMPVEIKAAKVDSNAICIMHNCPMEKKGEECPMMVLAEKGEKVTCPVCQTAIETQNVGASQGEEARAVGTPEAGPELPMGYASILITPERQQLIGIRTEVVEKKDASKTIRAAGRIAYDPDLYQAESEYIESFKSFKSVKASEDPSSSLSATKTSADASVGADWASKLMDSAKTKLTRMGLNAEMIEALQNEQGPDKSLLYAVTGGNAWVYANIYEYEIPLVKVGDEITVEIQSSPGTPLKGNIRAIDTVVDPATRTVRVRATVKNDNGLLKPDMYVTVSLGASLGEVILVPADAVFFGGKTDIVFVAKGRGLFEPRQIVVGTKAGDFYVVSKGLLEGETVVTNGNFLVDSESKLKAALNRIAPPPVSDDSAGIGPPSADETGGGVGGHLHGG